MPLEGAGLSRLAGEDADTATIAAVKTLIARWARHCDDRNVAAFAALFAPGATLEVNGERHSGQAIVGWLDTQSANPAGCHLTMNVIVEGGGPDRASSTADFVFVRRDGGTGPWQTVNVGRYTDNFIHVDGAWLFSRRQITLR